MDHISYDSEPYLLVLAPSVHLRRLDESRIPILPLDSAGVPFGDASDTLLLVLSVAQGHMIEGATPFPGSSTDLHLLPHNNSLTVG